MATAIERAQGEVRGAAPHRFHTLTGVQILATGAYAPKEVIRNEDLALLGYDADWIFRRTGIRERRRAASDEATSDLAYEAARRCLEAAKIDAGDIDLILLATCTPDTYMPSAACYLQRKLGCSAAAMDLNAACSGFMFALVTGAQFVKSGASRQALIVGAETMLRTVNPDDHKTYPLFGDGAGAVLLGRGDAQQGLLSYTLGTDGDGANLLYIPAGGFREPVTIDSLLAQRQYIHMEGRPVFKWAVRMVADTIRELLRDVGVTTKDVDAVVLHQANVRIIDAVANELGLASEKVIVNLEHYGNTSAASMPLVLDEACRDDRIHRGNLVLFCGFGAGLTWGAALMRW